MATAGRATLFSRPDRRGRARAARVHAAAVHALHGHRRAARPARLDRGVGDAAAGAAGDARPRGEPLADRSRGGCSSAARRRTRRASGTASRPRSCAGRCCTSCAAGGPHARARAARARPRAHRRRQPRRAAHHGVHAGPARAGDDARTGRAGAAPDRRRHRPAGRRVGPGGGRGAAPARRRRCARDPESCPQTIAAPVLRAARGGAAGQPRRRATAACCRSAPPGAPTPGRSAAMDLVDRIRDRHIPAARFPRRRVARSPARPRSASTSSTRPTARSRGSCSRCSSSPTCC